MARCTATRNARKNLSFWWMFQPEHPRHDDRVAEARDRKQLREALEQAEHDGLEVGDGVHGRAREAADAGRRSVGGPKGRRSLAPRSDRMPRVASLRRRQAGSGTIAGYARSLRLCCLAPWPRRSLCRMWTQVASPICSCSTARAPGAADAAGQRRRDDPLQRRRGQTLSGPMLIQARDLADNLDKDARRSWPPLNARAASTATITLQHGTLSFADTAGSSTPELAQAELFAAQAAQGRAGPRPDAGSAELTLPLERARVWARSTKSSA